jgi:serine/threonine-protein kinase
MVEDARRWVSIDGRSAAAHTALANALFAAGAPEESVLQAMKQSWAGEPRQGPEEETIDRVSLAVLSGDFERVEELVRTWQEQIAGRPDQKPHADAALERIRMYAESGRTKEAGEEARAFLKRMGAWAEPAIAADWAMRFLPFARRAGLLTAEDLEKDRIAWDERVRKKWSGAAGGREEDLAWVLWIDGDAASVGSEEEARSALSRMPKSPLPPESARWLALDAQLGRVLVLGGRPADAIPHLRRMVKSCAAISDPWAWVTASLHLGMALEATGDRDGAAAAYEAVIARWGKAKPRSVSADTARERLRALTGKR